MPRMRSTNYVKLPARSPLLRRPDHLLPRDLCSPVVSRRKVEAADVPYDIRVRLASGFIVGRYRGV
jgi:hypothetical protein